MLSAELRQNTITVVLPYIQATAKTYQVSLDLLGTKHSKSRNCVVKNELFAVYIFVRPC